VLYICSAVTFLFAWWLRPQRSIESPEEQLRTRIRFWLPLPIALYMMLSLPLVVAGAGRYGGGPMVVVAIFELGLILNVIYRFRRKRELQRRLNGLCQQCGYCLNGNVSGICPECGTKIPVRLPTW
jgi:hypothetical protein